MPKAKGRKSSNRKSLKDKYKIEKKVKEHNRKLRRAARKNPKAAGRKLKKDPGIPNLWPFKENLMQSAEQRREQRAEEEKVRRQQQQRRLKSLQQLAADAATKNVDFNNREDFSRNGQGNDVGRNSRRQFYRELKKVIEDADVLLQVLDARDPAGCRCRDLERMIKNEGSDKSLIFVLNKCDLVPKSNLQQWLAVLRREYPSVVFKASSGTGGSNHKATSRNDALGVDELLQTLRGAAKQKGKRIRVGFLGYPNVGKSSIINTLKRNNVAAVAAVAGHTKQAQHYALDKDIVLIDSPGIVFHTDDGSNAVQLRNCIRLEEIADPLAVIPTLLERCGAAALMELYAISNFETATEFIELVAQRRGKIKKGGVIDAEAAAKSVLQDWNSGKIPFYSMPPNVDDVTGLVMEDADTCKALSWAVVDDSAVLNRLKDTTARNAIVLPSEPMADEPVISKWLEEEAEEEAGMVEQYNFATDFVDGEGDEDDEDDLDDDDLDDDDDDDDADLDDMSD